MSQEKIGGAKRVTDSKKKKKAKKPQSITIKLQFPVQWGEDNLVEEIVLHRPKAKHIEHLSGSPSMKELLSVAQKVSQQPPALIKDLDAEDALAVVEAVADFLDSGQETGKMRSF